MLHVARCVVRGLCDGAQIECPLLATRMSVKARSDLNGHPDEIACQMHFLQQSTLTGHLSTFDVAALRWLCSESDPIATAM